MTMKKILIIALIHISYSAYSYEEVPVNWEPQTSHDWEIIPAVLELQSNIPESTRASINKDLKSSKNLKAGKVYTYVQDVKEENNGNYKKMAVEYSTRLISVPYDDFIKIIPPHEWGSNLYNLIGRGISHQDSDDNNNISRQVERMILAGLGQNMDMTKVEVFQYESEKVTVYWRVRASDNNTTDSDIGMLEIKKNSDNDTLVTFHSAHRLRLFGLPLPSSLIHYSVGNTFLKHLDNYKAIVESAN